jgi:hypothetical protein
MKSLIVFFMGFCGCLAAQADTLLQFTRGTAPQSFLTGVSVQADGRTMTVQTRNGAASPGGRLQFADRWAPTRSIDVANFVGNDGLQGGSLAIAVQQDREWAWLKQPPGARYTVATARPGGHSFVLSPVTMHNGTIVVGVIVTDGSVGELSSRNIVDWNIYAYHP